MDELIFKRKSWRYADWIVLAILLAGGIFIRTAYLKEITAEPTFEHALYDPQYNDYWARSLVTGDWTPPEGVNDPEIQTTPHGRPPGYSYFLASVYYLFGLDYWTPRVVQIIFGLTNVILIFLLCRWVFGRGTALLAAFFMTFYWVFIYFEGLLTYPIVAILLLLILMHTLESWTRHPLFISAFLAGLYLGCFGLLRPNGLLLAPAILVWMAWILHRRGWTKRFLPGALALTLGITSILAPCIIRNLMVARDFVFLSSFGGLNLYVGNHLGASGVEPRIPELTELTGMENWSCFDYPLIVKGLARKAGKETMRFSAANAYFYRKAFGFIREHPDEFLRLTARKALLFWGPREITNDTVMEYDKRFSPVLSWLPGFPWVVTLFVPGALLMWRDVRKKRRVPSSGAPDLDHIAEYGVLMGLIIFTYFLSVLPFFIAGRYRVPILPFMLVFGAYGVNRMLAAVLGRDIRTVLVWSVTAVLACLAAHANFGGYEASEAVWHFRQGVAWNAKGDLARAMSEYQKAVEQDPGNAAFRGNLAHLYADAGKIDESIREYKEALKHSPEDPLLNNNLGYELALQGQWTDAQSYYEAALKSNPDFAFALTNLGNAELVLGNADAAVVHFERVSRLESENAAAYYNLGRAYFALGRFPKAVEAYRKAILLRTDYSEAMNNLGWTLQCMGDLDSALVEYQHAVEINPSNLLARNNLGNALLLKGQNDRALQQFRLVLENNPQESQALYNLGNTLAQQEKWEESVAWYEKALESRPQFADAHNNLGYVLRRLGREDEALAQFDAALKIQPDSVLARANRADTLVALGRIDEATQLYDELLAQNPDDAALRSKREALNTNKMPQ